MMLWKKIKYPKFILLILTFVLAYFLFLERTQLPFHGFLTQSGYLGAFLMGIFFTYGFTTPIAIALFLIVAPTLNPFIAAPIAGAGAVLSDLVIFKFIRFSLKDEIKKLSREKVVLLTERSIPIRLRHILLPVLGGFIIASPLPDEAGVTLLASSHFITTRTFIFISYILNTLGILFILIIGRAI